MQSIKKELSKEEIENLNRHYYQIAKQEIFKGIELCRVNAKSQFYAALKLETDNYGLANSLLILSAEECIKCFVLLAVYVNVQVPFEITPIFSRHPAKHVRGKELNGFVKTLSLLLGSFASKKGERIKSILKIVFDMFGGSEDIEWWDNANSEKNKGLYVDFRSEQFHSPLEFTGVTYEASKEIVSRFIRLADKTELLNAEDYKLLPNGL